ncbi:MAG: BREX system ATP-binding domain-containing protein, partial [Sciscionella sp.]
MSLNSPGLAERRAIEALRSGVPNSDAVTALGSGQSDIEGKFSELIDAVARDGGARRGRASLLLGAGFGQGKSHLLTHLGHLARESGFVVSTVVISKETPLYDPTKVMRSAVESAVAPDGARDVVAETAERLDPDSATYLELLRWLRGPGRDINERFDATLLLHQRVATGSPGADEEFLDAIVRFWSGDSLPMADLRRHLKAIGESKSFSFAPVTVKDLTRQRLRFLPRLLRAGGYTGWVMLLDEAELI